MSNPVLLPNNSNASTSQIIVKSHPSTFQSKFPVRPSLPSFRTINKKINGTTPPKHVPSRSAQNSNQDAETPTTSNTKINPEFSALSRIVAKRSADGGEKTIITQMIPSCGQITRLPIVVERPKVDEGNSCARTRSFDVNRHGKTQKKTKKTRVNLDLNLPTSSADFHPKMAITSEPLLVYYQDQLSSYKKQIRELQSDIKNYRRRESILKKQTHGPTLASLCKKTFSESNGKVKRQVVQKLKESISVLLESCTEEDKKATLTKAFPDVFTENKLTIEQTWLFEHKFQVDPNTMDKYRQYLSQFNTNPFATRRQVNTYKEQRACENPAMLNVEVAENSDNDDETSVYVPNILTTVCNNVRRTNPAIITTTFRNDLYDSNSSVAAQYNLIQQQEQYLRRATNTPNYPPRQTTESTTSAFLPTTSYNSLYSGHY